MTITSLWRAFGLVLILCAGLAGAALAQNAPAAEPLPKPDAGTTSYIQCIFENSNYEMRGKHPTLVITLENRCEARMKCKVFAYVISAKGAAQGRATLMLAPKSKGAAAKKSYAMRVKMIGGSSQTARECGPY